MMAMAVAMHPIWQSGGVVMAAGVGGALLLQVLVQYFLPAAWSSRDRHRLRGAAGVHGDFGMGAVQRPGAGAARSEPDRQRLARQLILDGGTIAGQTRSVTAIAPWRERAAGPFRAPCPAAAFIA